MTRPANLVFLGLLSGCASVSQVRTATMEADPTEIGAESIALQNQLSLAYTRERPSVTNGTRTYRDPDLCRYTLPNFQQNGNYSYTRHQSPEAGRAGRTAAQQFECLYLIQDPSPAQALQHVRAGMALSDLYCDLYFRRIARRWNERMFARNTTNDVGTAISAILGLTAAGSVATGAVGVAFGLADAAFRNYDNVFVVSPDLPALQNLVRQKQVELREAIEAAPPTDFYRAQSQIIGYARLCSYTGMRGLLNVAVDQSINARRPANAIIEDLTRVDRLRRETAERQRTEREAEATAVEAERAAQQRIDQPVAQPDPAPPAPAPAEEPIPTDDGNDPLRATAARHRA